MSKTLTVRGVPDAALRALRSSAAANRRSLNSELLLILERAASETRAEAERPRVRESAVPAYQPGRKPAGPSLAAEVDRAALAAVCRRLRIMRLALFGSQARGDARFDSDIDVLVDFEPGMTPGLGIVTAAEALRPVLGGRRVDLVTRRGLRPALLERILATSVPLYGA